MGWDRKGPRDHEPLALPSPRAVPFGQRLTELAEEMGSQVALVVGGSDGTDTDYSWSSLESRANQIARLLQGGGVADGDIVVMALPNSFENVVGTFAAWKLGASVLPLRYELPDWERDKLLGIAGHKAVISGWDGVGGLHFSLGDLQHSRDLDDSPLDDYPIPAHARLVASSGSTGTPKIIVGPDAGVYNAQPVNSGDVQAGAGSGIALCASPLYHTNGAASCFMPLLAGSKVVLMERFDAARWVDLVERHHVTGTILVPTMLQRIARLDGIGDSDLSSLASVNYGGASLPEWVARTWLGLIPPQRFIFSYGGSEGIGLTLCTGEEWLAHPGTSGRPVDCEIAILDPDGNELPVGEIGQIYMRRPGPEAFRYVGIPTPDAIDGGYRTFGDMGSVDADGFLYIADRRQDMIVTGGVNVFPAEVEAALSEHPDVEDVVVIGIPDAEWGHRVHAVIQPRDKSVPLDVDGLRTFSRIRLSGPKVPKTIEVVDELPRTGAGKINRSQLIEQRTV